MGGYEQVPAWIVQGYHTLLAEVDAQLGTTGPGGGTGRRRLTGRGGGAALPTPGTRAPERALAGSGDRGVPAGQPARRLASSSGSSCSGYARGELEQPLNRCRACRPGGPAS
jgi:hypothetical protein